MSKYKKNNIFSDFDMLVGQQQKFGKWVTGTQTRDAKEIRVMIYLWFKVRNEYIRTGVMIVMIEDRLGCTDDYHIY